MKNNHPLQCSSYISMLFCPGVQHFGRCLSIIIIPKSIEILKTNGHNTTILILKHSPAK